MVIRKLLAVVFLFASVLTAQCQIAKGTIMAGGNVGFQFTTDKVTTTTQVNFSFNPLIGGFVAKNVVLGISPLVRYGQQAGVQSNQNSFRSQLTVGAGPFARYYIKIGEKAFVFIHAAPLNLAAEWDRFSKDKTQPFTRYGVINWQVGPGVSVMLAKGIALEVGAYYSGTWHQQNLYKDGNLVGNPGKTYVDHGMLLNVGIQVYLNRHKKAETATP